MGRTLLPGETELQRWSQLALTSHRLINSVEGSNGSSTSVLLRALEWSTIGRSHQPLWLVVAVLVLLASLGVLRVNTELGMAGIVAAALALVGYLGSRRTTMIFAAGEGRISVVLGGDAKSRDNARIFANAVDHAALRVTGIPL